ncbi:LysR substrate-binding domain-containing protein [Pendulispora albinea]|uniref:LysR substrate-binding domain-containing protein n=1 Tax=Pendulispora albinea TaxID=2741071 RepID=A0ABZ2MBB2_9BACT
MSKSHSTARALRLPPLNAARVFEACARLGSTVAAASELGVTHGAVSKQVALLEAWLEIPLFNRSGVRLAPTAAGARYAAALGRALELVDAATREVTDSASGPTRVVRVSTTASFATLWLLPRLERFHARHPDTEVWISETKALVSLGPEGSADVALRMGSGPWPGVRAESLMSDHLIPVCAPKLAARLRHPPDLARATLLHDQDPRAAWGHWLEAAALGRPVWAERGPRLPNSAALLQASADGQGVTLAYAKLAEPYRTKERLVQPFGPAVPLGPTYWLILPRRGTPTTHASRVFAAWVREEAKRSP